jgi:uncharacterized membrane protein YagU involved in acid resistance
MKKDPSVRNASFNGRVFRAILYTGLIAGILDGLAAVIVYVVTTGGNPLNVFLFIASSVFGRNAFTGGLPVALIGVLFHFVIATLFTAFYFFIYPKMKMLGEQKIAAGLLYGIFVWLIMNILVLPQTLVPQFPFDFLQALRGVVILMLLIGLPISLLAHRHYAH